RRAGSEQRTFRLQNVDVEGIDRSRRRAEAYEDAERLDAIEGGRKGRLANAVIDHLAQLPTGDLLHLGDEILVAVEDHVMGAVFLGEFGFVSRSDGADYVRPEVVGPLAGDEPDAAGGGMDKHVIALLHLVRPPN